MINQQLYDRILAFDLDDPEASLPFSARLAREQGWSLVYTLRAIEEYKRFMYLIVGHGTTCSPSTIVDEVWHLHLIYTRSYWDLFCGEVLQTKVHHQPTTGGAQELNKHVDLYTATLNLYRAVFDEVPPADIWLTTTENFNRVKQQGATKTNLIRKLKALKK